MVRKIVINYSKTVMDSVFWLLNRLHFELTLKELLHILQLKIQVEACFLSSGIKILQFLKISKIFQKLFVGSRMRELLAATPAIPLKTWSEKSQARKREVYFLCLIFFSVHVFPLGFIGGDMNARI